MIELPTLADWITLLTLAILAAAFAIRVWAPDLGDRPVMGIVTCWLIGHGEIQAVKKSGIRLGGFRCECCGKSGESYGDFGLDETGYVRGRGRR